MKSLPVVNTSVDTFGSLVSKLNGVINLANTEIVTANTTGALTIGVGYVQGSLGSNTIYAGTLSGGNSGAAANLSVSSNTVFQLSVIANVGLKVGNSGVMSINAFTYASTNTDPQPIDTFAVASWRSGKYVISVTDPATSKYQATEILVLQDGGNAYATEYATLTSNGSIATFSADVSGGNCRILVTPSTPIIQLSVSRTLNAV